ncbi:MAG: carboxypeptidase-like regulatory domain-containing protein [Terriglobales bacterium]
MLLFLALGAGAEETQIPSGPFRIAGTVVNARVGNALARCRVTITDSKNRQSVQFMITGDDGRFEFHVPKGKYSLEGAKRGFITALYNQHERFSSAIVTGADVDTESLVLRLTASAVLTGRVLDESGEPVRNAQIMVYRQEHALGESRTAVVGGAVTDDQGRYEVTPIEEGTYFVSAKASPWYAVHPVANGEGATNRASPVDSSLDVSYPITYYGDATEAEGAAPILVRGGDRLEAEIHMSPVPSVHLLVRVPEGGDFPVLYKTTFDGAEQPEAHSVTNVASGVYELSGIAAGRYTLRMPGSNGRTKEPTEVSLGSGGELDVSGFRATSEIKATVQIADAVSIPADLRILLRNSKGRMFRYIVDEKGKAELSDVIAGRYEISAESPGQRYAVVRIVSEAGTVSGHGLNVPAGASLNVALSLVGGSVTVDGFAKREGKAVSGAMIILIPKDAEADRDRFRRDESDLDGSFTLREVIPGSYTVIAIDDGWDLDWAEPAVLAQYLKRGQTVEIGNRSATVVHLTDAVDVQPK